MNARREFPAKVMVEAFKRCGGHCEKCTAKLYPRKFAYDHVIPDQMGGEPTLDNCQVLCSACHKVKTKADVGDIAKAKRLERGHLIKKQSKWRKPPPGYNSWTRRIERERT